MTVKEVLIAINASPNMFKYPIGNKMLVDRLKHYEGLGWIKWDMFSGLWSKA